MVGSAMAAVLGKAVTSSARPGLSLLPLPRRREPSDALGPPAPGFARAASGGVCVPPPSLPVSPAARKPKAGSCPKSFVFQCVEYLVIGPYNKSTMFVNPCWWQCEVTVVTI